MEDITQVMFWHSFWFKLWFMFVIFNYIVTMITLFDRDRYFDDVVKGDKRVSKFISIFLPLCLIPIIHTYAILVAILIISEDEY